jgi:hypothetical protein
MKLDFRRPQNYIILSHGTQSKTGLEVEAIKAYEA